MHYQYCVTLHLAISYYVIRLVCINAYSVSRIFFYTVSRHLQAHSRKLLCVMINVARKKFIGRELLKIIGCHMENNRDISGAYENSIIGNKKSIICQGLHIIHIAQHTDTSRHGVLLHKFPTSSFSFPSIVT